MKLVSVIVPFVMISFCALVPAKAMENSMSQANAHQFSFDTLDGEKIALADYRDKVVMVVNTASKCGFTPQYAELQALYETYADQGLVVIGVPSADFGGQEFDSGEEVKAFVDEKFAVTFPLASPQNVSGKKAHPFYKWARGEVGFLGSPKWNFHKYVIGKDGQLINWYASTTSPTAAKVTKVVEDALAVGGSSNIKANLAP